MCVEGVGGGEMTLMASNNQTFCVHMKVHFCAHLMDGKDKPVITLQGFIEGTCLRLRVIFSTLFLF